MAIAFGAISSVTNASSITSVAVSGSDTVGFVSVNGDDGASQSITAITWGGVSMTKINEVRMPSAANRWMSTWYVVNPGSSATIAFTGGTYWRAFSYYVTGAKQTGIPDSSNVGTTTGTSISVATTVVASNSWLFLMKADGTGGQTDTPSNAVTTARLSADAGGLALLDSNGTVGTGSQTATDSISGSSTPLGGIAFSIAPAVASGPTNLKSLDTNVKANIKSYNTNVIANIKSINTNA